MYEYRRLNVKDDMIILKLFIILKMYEKERKIRKIKQDYSDIEILYITH